MFSYETFPFLKGALFIGGRNMDIMKEVEKRNETGKKKNTKKPKRNKGNRKERSDKKIIKGRGIKN